MLARLATIYAEARKTDRAFEVLQQAVALSPAGTPALGSSYGDLKLNEVWDPLRGDPRFEQIVASLAPKEST
jgi:hypothetical protein